VWIIRNRLLLRMKPLMLTSKVKFRQSDKKCRTVEKL
jgi:hypothetical protein